LAVVGEMATVSVWVVGCVGMVLTLEALPQATRARDTSRSREVRRNEQSMITIVWSRERGGETGPGDRKRAGGSEMEKRKITRRCRRRGRTRRREGKGP
jgi:hypothetical protein